VFAVQPSALSTISGHSVDLAISATHSEWTLSPMLYSPNIDCGILTLLCRSVKRSSVSVGKNLARVCCFFCVVSLVSQERVQVDLGMWNVEMTSDCFISEMKGTHYS